MYHYSLPFLSVMSLWDQLDRLMSRLNQLRDENRRHLHTHFVLEFVGDFTFVQLLRLGLFDSRLRDLGHILRQDLDLNPGVGRCSFYKYIISLNYH